MKIPLVIYDADNRRLTQIKKQYPDVQTAKHADDIFTDEKIRACIIATPPLTHFQLAKQAIAHNKHVLIEKPMTQNINEARQLVRMAKKNKCSIMVDHIYLFSPLTHTLKGLIKKGTIGRVLRVMSIRGKGRMHPGSSVLWDLAPHDIAVAAYLLDADPRHARAFPALQPPPKQPHDALYQLFYPGGILLQGQLSWTTPVKKRLMEIVGETGAITVEWREGAETLTVFAATMHKGQLSYSKKRQQTLIPKKSPMHRMLEHFISHVANGTILIPDGTHALKSVQIITALHRSIERNGATVRM